ncbi:MAG: hypothetical protein DMG26_07590 [Acidobacteria bacterium]|nr:MAG: hypothetical protein DMG26_07590 [Acidobacteriota bacterium]
MDLEFGEVQLACDVGVTRALAQANIPLGHQENTETYSRGKLFAVCALRAKARFVHKPGLLLGGVVFLCLLLLTCNFSLRSLSLVQPDRFDDIRPGQRIKAFRKNQDSKSRLVGGTEEIERVLRVLPTRDDLLAVVIDLERREEDDLRIGPGCSSVLRRNC